MLAGINGLLSQDPDGSDVADISDVLAKRAKDRASSSPTLTRKTGGAGKANLAEWNKQTQITPAAKALHDSLNEAEQELATLRMTAAEAKAYRVELAGGSKEAGDMVRKWWNQVEAEKAAVAQAKKLEAEVEAVEEAMVKRAEELDGGVRHAVGEVRGADAGTPQAGRREPAGGQDLRPGGQGHQGKTGPRTD